MPAINARDYEFEDAAQAKAVAAAADEGRECWVSETYAGPPTDVVVENKCYWLVHTGGNPTGSLIFQITFNPDSVLRSQTQTFHFPNGYGGGTTTPFGVPNWGGDPIHGPALLTVTTDHGCCTYRFKVTG